MKYVKRVDSYSEPTFTCVGFISKLTWTNAFHSLILPSSLCYWLLLTNLIDIKNWFAAWVINDKNVLVNCA